MTARDGSQTVEPKGQMLIYQSPDNSVTIEVRLEGETVRLTQQRMAELFESSRSNIVEHIGNIYAEGELEQTATCREFRQVRLEGSRKVARTLPHYNLDMIISLGYRIKSKTATQFRRWATERLKEHLDSILAATGQQQLQGAGKISHQDAIDKATAEYRKYQTRTLSQVERDYLETIKRLGSKVKCAEHNTPNPDR